MQSLRDKLLKAGLVTQEQAKEAETEKAKKPAEARAEAPRREPPRERPIPGGRPRPPARNAGYSHERPSAPERERPIPKLPPLPGSREHQRIVAKQQRQLDLELYELVRSGEVPLQIGDTAFHFVTRKGKLRRLQLSPEQAKLLEEGKLAVVERQEPDRIDHSLVAPEVAEKMHALFPKAVRFLNKEGAQVGFLTDDELAKKKAEAAADPTGNDAPDAPDAPPAAEPPRNDEPKPVSETWITIKRST
jgi:uncharacterized protein YaiL (DUF2058 family)